MCSEIIFLSNSVLSKQTEYCILNAYKNALVSLTAKFYVFTGLKIIIYSIL